MSRTDACTNLNKYEELLIHNKNSACAHDC